MLVREGAACELFLIVDNLRAYQAALVTDGVEAAREQTEVFYPTGGTPEPSPLRDSTQRRSSTTTPSRPSRSDVCCANAAHEPGLTSYAAAHGPTKASLPSRLKPLAIRPEPALP